MKTRIRFATNRDPLGKQRVQPLIFASFRKSRSVIRTGRRKAHGTASPNGTC